MWILSVGCVDEVYIVLRNSLPFFEWGLCRDVLVVEPCGNTSQDMIGPLTHTLTLKEEEKDLMNAAAQI